MGVVENIGADQWPKQGRYLGQRCEVVFRYATSRPSLGTIVPLCSGMDGHHQLLHTIGRASFETIYHVSLDVHARLTDAYAQANGRTTKTGELA